MLNFQLYNPTNYLFGKGQIAKLPELIPVNTKVLLTYGGGSIKKNGIYEQVMTALKGYEIVEFSGIEPNPKYETLMKAVKICRDQKIGFILAVGGGSVIDGTKFISAAVNCKSEPSDILHRKVTVGKNTIPFGTVLTLPATGSEMNSGGVVTILATQEKLSFGSPELFPQFSICDPEVIISLPKRQLENGVVDAYMHVLEQYMTVKHDALLQDRIAEGVLQTLIEIGPDVVKTPENYELASNFMWSCTMALNGLLNKGVPVDWSTHMIGHELTALYNIDHARTLAIVAPNLYTVMFDSKKEKLTQYGKRVFNLTGSDDEIARQAIAKTEEFFQKMGMKTKLSENTDNYEDTAKFVADRFTERGWIGLGEAKNIGVDQVKEILEMSY